ncbi:MAG: hypothetical protein H6766_07125 [Candidatus Peribacteria bacterium]|nr:MAG: hypothetical protein H6766_07125 [Candidatus Peribacteria bacterium]
MTTTDDQESPFAFVDQEQMNKAQNVIDMIKNQEEFTQEESDEIISFIYEKL